MERRRAAEGSRAYKAAAEAAGAPDEVDMADTPADAVAPGAMSRDELDGEAPDDTDHANYFCEYAYLYHQMDMLEDSHRTGTYFSAITDNAGAFDGKVVLDVGAGTCLLAIFAARAGAKMVYAVEATDMAQRGRRIVEANGLSDVIRVLQGTIETVSLPCKVDIIVSEWMGYFLLRESMLDSVLLARDRFLLPGGAMYPSQATLFLAPVTQVKVLQTKQQQWEAELPHWHTFSNDMHSWYDLDFSCVQEEFMQEQRQYYLQTSSFVNLTPKQLVGPPKALMQLDLADAPLDELKSPTRPSTCVLRVNRDVPVEGFCGFFETAFRGSTDCPADREVLLTTAPTTGTSTHWGQQVFGFYPPIAAKRGDTLECTVWIRRQKRNHRLLVLDTTFVHKSSGGAVKAERSETYYVD